MHRERGGAGEKLTRAGEQATGLPSRVLQQAIRAPAKVQERGVGRGTEAPLAPLRTLAARGGGLRLHASFPDSIHLSKLIFDIHSDLEGRHGDNSQKVENNIIATNMNYWPPG